MTDKKKIYAVKTNDGFYLAEKIQDRYHEQFDKNLIVDGEVPCPSFLSNWVFVKSKPVKIEKQLQSRKENFRFELVDPEMESEKIPARLERDEVTYQYEWKTEYEHLESLYKSVWDDIPPEKIEVEFKLEIICEVEEIDESGVLNYKVVDSGSYGEEIGEIADHKRVQHQLVDKIVFPDIALQTRPSRISSANTYKIIRKYVQDNINPKYAKITSDYQFCFTVKKKISMAEPEEYMVDANAFSNLFAKRKRKPKYEKRLREDREVTIFEMTDDVKKYEGYTPIAGFVGKSHKDLKKNIDTFLKNLIDFINSPVVDCPHCNGTGVRIEEKFTSK